MLAQAEAMKAQNLAAQKAIIDARDRQNENYHG